MQETIQKQEIIIVDPVYAVKELLSKLKKLKVQKDAECSELLIKLLDIQEMLESKQAPFAEEASRIEQEIKTIMLNVQRPIKTENGMATYRRGSVRASYNREALDAIQDERIKNVISQYRKETQSEPSIKIEVF